jgi:phage terminase large subunit-like protein
MEARFARVVSASTLLVCLCLSPLGSAAHAAAGYKTTNFVVSAPTPQLAKEIGDQAEVYRKQLAMEWLGKELPAWSKPCPIKAQVQPNLGAGGATKFVFDRGEVFGWEMNIQGSRERILDSVLPHEVTHTIFASYFRQPVPRWADEGACTTVEHPSEVSKQERNLIQFLKTGRGIPFSQMFAMKEYPADVMPLYAQGHSLSEWLIESRGRKAFLEFVGDGMKDENWPRAVHEHYGFSSLLTMQTAWNDWVKQGRPRVSPGTSPIGQVASNTSDMRRAGTPATPATFRSQSPDDVTPIGAAPTERTIAATAVTVPPTTPSVYAVAAQRVQPERGAQDEPPRPLEPASSSAASVYDASRGGATLRR